MVEHNRDYGSRGRIGVAVPQANPTVEPEMNLLLPAKTNLLVSRLTAAGAEARERHVEYYSNFEKTLTTYDTLKLDALGFACTASSYQVGRKAEDEKFEELSQKVGYPIFSVTLAIEHALQHLNVEKVAIGAPYPQWSIDMCMDYWKGRGFDVLSATRIEINSSDTRAIYELKSSDALATLDQVDFSDADAILLSGTGMPGLAAVVALMEKWQKPVLSSNICLTWDILRHLDLPDEGDPGSAPRHPLLNGWQSRISEL